MNGVFLTEESNESGVWSIYLCKEAAIVSTPEWDGIAEPPVSVSRAIALAAEHIKKNNKAGFGERLDSVNLCRISWPRLKNRWYYMLEFASDETRKGVDVPVTISVVVLMNGSIVIPIKSNKSYT